MRKVIGMLLITLICASVMAQNQKPCSSTEASQFDFWVGDWELTWKDSVRGTNRIHKVMDGCGIQENFSDPKTGYNGASWSVYNPARKMWQQTWIDNGGGYIALSGAFVNGEMVLKTQPAKKPDNTEIIYRMVFYNITPDKFDWKWESSTDGEKTWKSNWVIQYKRKS